MLVGRLTPCPKHHTQFAWSHHVTAPGQPGCYALVTYSGVVLYVGLASSSIADRMAVHLDTEEKRKGTRDGVPFWFYYLECPACEVNALERGWMNQSILDDGDIPPLNKVYSPV
jgi:hypothetical protein